MTPSPYSSVSRPAFRWPSLVRSFNPSSDWCSARERASGDARLPVAVRALRLAWLGHDDTGDRSAAGPLCGPDARLDRHMISPEAAIAGGRGRWRSAGRPRRGDRRRPGAGDGTAARAGGLYQVSASFPSVTGPAYVPVRHGATPGARGDAGTALVRPRALAAAGRWHRRAATPASTSGIPMAISIAQLPTLFELAQPSLAGLMMIGRGATHGRIGRGVRWSIRAGCAHFRGDLAVWRHVERAAIGEFLRRFERVPPRLVDAGHFEPGQVRPCVRQSIPRWCARAFAMSTTRSRAPRRSPWPADGARRCVSGWWATTGTPTCRSTTTCTAGWTRRGTACSRIRSCTCDAPTSR